MSFFRDSNCVQAHLVHAPREERMKVGADGECRCVGCPPTTALPAAAQWLPLCGAVTGAARAPFAVRRGGTVRGLRRI
eukprot:gene29811-62640_t